MPGAYPRHPAGQGGRFTSQPAARTGKSNAGSWSASSSAEDVRTTTMGLSSHGDEEEASSLASDRDDVSDNPHNIVQTFRSTFIPYRLRLFSVRKVILACLMLVLFCSAWTLRKDHKTHAAQEHQPIDKFVPLVPQLSAGYTAQEDGQHPVQWLRENTFLDARDTPSDQLQQLEDTRPRAAFIALVRNEEAEDMAASIMQLESRFNGRETHHYDWVFFNNEEFTDEFKAAVSRATNSQCYFELIPEEHWSVPSWIDTTRFDVGRQFMGGIGVGKAWLQSYHHMCRWNAGIFALEERLADYDWYWRVEPAVNFYCDINYDVFRFMRDNDMAYGFNMAILDDARSFPSLWERTKTFIDGNEDLVDDDADFNWLLHTAEDQDDTIRPQTGAEQAPSDGEYNNCQFYSNFEIGSLDFFRGKEHRAYFDHLDQAGGFYYERFGDAPVHTLSVSMFLPKTRIWYFRDIGYAHGLCEQCPPHEHQLTIGSQGEDGQQPRELEQQAGVTTLEEREIRTLVIGPFETFAGKHRRWKTMAQDVERQKGIPGLSCGCTVSAIDSNNAKLVPYESKQRKPSDSCIRKFLGGKWLERKNKVSDFNSATGSVASGDGVEYVLDGREGNPFQ
ncbi:putative mannosyltransferase ktr4 [Parahypoxylon ruwenzoriense]